LAATAGSSTIHGHDAIVFTLPLLFFTIVIFMTYSSGAPLRADTD
jgi:hypothetical protein